MLSVFLNILVLFGLFASNDFSRNLLNTALGSFSRIPEDIHQGPGVTSSDQSHSTVRESGYLPPPQMGSSSHTSIPHTHVKPTVKPKRNGSASPSIEMRAVAVR
jgi:hypothetical protein